MKSNTILMQDARETLKTKWGIAIKVYLISQLLLLPWFFLSNVHFALIVPAYIISGPITFGFSLFCLNLSRKQDISESMLFSGFRIFTKTLCTYFLLLLLTFLWTLLLIVPGIIMSIAYSQTFFLLIDNPSMTPLQAIKKSKEMMRGHKARYFYLLLRFIGLGMLCILTLGVGLLWVVPYSTTTFSYFYDDLKTNS